MNNTLQPSDLICAAERAAIDAAVDSMPGYAFNPGTRRIDEIIIHCSATRRGMDFHAADIRNWHLQRGFNDIGYHFVINLDGNVETGRPVRLAGAHCLNHNRRSIGVCYVGGLDSDGRPADTRTPAQSAALLSLLRRLRRHFPQATIHGHRDFAAKACPCFDATSTYKNL